MRAALLRNTAAAISLGLMATLAVSGSPAAPQGKGKNKAAVAKPAPMKPGDPATVAAAIDAAIDAKLAEAKIPVSPVCDDAEFVRRASLDIRGRIPTVGRVTDFLADTSPDKRSKLVEAFLADKEYGEHFGIIWFHRMVKPNTDNVRVISPNFMSWLGDRFNENQPWDRTVSDILTASGDRDKNPATVFWLAHYEKNPRHPINPARVAGTASHVFLGVKLECCECHNHPFDETLKQTDFWGVAAFFTATTADHVGNKDAEAPAIRDGVRGGGGAAKAKAKAKGGASTVAPGAIEIPDTKGKIAKATYLHGAEPKSVATNDLRGSFANWVVAPDNAYFAKATVNKLWANFFGRGIVNPIDDMRDDTPNTHPELLKRLADEFKATGFDHKQLIRAICASRAYQRTSQSLPANESDDSLYSHMKLKVISADMLYDSLAVALEHGIAATGRAAAGKQRRYGGDGREAFRKFFNAEADDDAGVVDDYTHGIPQALRLMNAEKINDTAAVVKSALASDSPVDAIYLRALSRKATDTDRERALKYIATANSPQKGYADLLWVLLNSSEYIFNH